jgi:transposase
VFAESSDDEQIIERVAALDIGKAEIVCCIRLPAADGERRVQEVSTHSTMVPSLCELANRLVGLGVQRVVMEATSDYWRPPFYLFEAHGLEPWLVNAKDVKHLPGRPKTDRLDAVWLCKVAERQMLRPSFVPPGDIRRLRDLTRYRADLVGVRNAEKNRVDKLLEDACLKLSVVASDIFGVSGRAMMAALIAGERDPKALAELAQTRMRTKIGRLEEAFAGLRLGTFDDHHRFLLARMLARVDAVDLDIAAVDTQIGQHLAPFADAAARLDEIPGIGPTAAAIIIAEIGLDMTRFPTPPTSRRGRSSPPASTPPPARPKATARPGTGTATSPASWARPWSAPAAPTPSSAPATDASPADEAKRKPSSRSAAPCW